MKKRSLETTIITTQNLSTSYCSDLPFSVIEENDHIKPIVVPGIHPSKDVAGKQELNPLLNLVESTKSCEIDDAKMQQNSNENKIKIGRAHV